MCTAELFFPSWYGCVASKGYIIACARKIRRMFTIQRVFAPRDGGLACLPLYVTMAPQSVWQLSPNHARFPEGGLSSRSPPSLLPTLYSSSGTTMTVVLAEIACTLQEPSAHTLLRGFSGVEISKTDIDIRVADLSLITKTTGKGGRSKGLPHPPAKHKTFMAYGRPYVCDLNSKTIVQVW